MAEGYEIFQNVLNYKSEHGRIGECRSMGGGRDYCFHPFVWILIMLLPVLLPVIIGGGGLALLIYFVSSASSAGEITE